MGRRETIIQTVSFGKDFAWGVATASYQIEGAAYCAGGGKSVWDMFCARPGVISDGSNGDVACDHFNRFREDVRLMADLGIPNYRLSLSWPRILPEGTGRVDESGLAFYDRLIDELLANGITPWVTLFHWDEPYALYQRGGWLNPESPDWFAEYTQIVVDRLSDRVRHWMTLNEPQCFIGLGRLLGTHAPGDKLGLTEVLLAGHHSLLAHGKATQVIRARSKQPCEVGWAPVGAPKIPATNSPEDIEAARQAMFGPTPGSVWSNAWWNDPVFFGHYPEDAVEAYGAAAPVVKAGEMEIIQQPMDFYGANIYNAQTVRMGDDGKPEELPHPLGMARTIYHWPVTPEALYWGPKFFYERYKQPIVITENGLGLSDWIHQDGKVHDPQRIDFLSRYIGEFQRAADDGVPAKGFFQWSLMDNFEWNEGYRFRFGLVHVDYQTQVRTPKDSAYWYQNVIKNNGV
jgi:beta-glucosidase